MSRVFTLTDAHLFHEFVAETRGFASSAEHDAALEDGIRSTLTKRDTMWWGGDMTAGGRIDDMLKWVASLPGTHHLVAGNHCPVHPMHLTAPAKQRRYLEAFASVQSVARRRLGGRRVLLSHFPVEGDHTDESRYDAWRPRPFSGVLLHGHTHSKSKLSISGPTLQVHLGIDAWGMTPVSDAEIIALIEAESTPMPGCWCLYCESFAVKRPASWFRVCGNCGDKRCPAVADHRVWCASTST